MTAATDAVLALRTAYQQQDEAAARRLLADDLTFTSPQDDRIDRAAYLERCFPTAARFRRNELLDLAEVAPGRVLLRYAYELEDGGVFSNAEVIEVRDGRVADVQVYFGGPTRLSPAATP